MKLFTKCEVSSVKEKKIKTDILLSENAYGLIFDIIFHKCNCRILYIIHLKHIRSIKM